MMIKERQADFAKRVESTEDLVDLFDGLAAHLQEFTGGQGSLNW